MPLKPTNLTHESTKLGQSEKKDLEQIKKDVIALSKKKGLTDTEYLGELENLVYDSELDEEKMIYKLFYETRKKALLGSIPKSVYSLPQEDVITLNSDEWGNDAGATIYVGTKEGGILDINWLLGVAQNGKGSYYLWISADGNYGLTVEEGSTGYEKFTWNSFKNIIENEMDEGFGDDLMALKPDIKDDGTITVQEYNRLTEYLDKLLELNTGVPGSSAWCTLKIEKDRSLKLQCWAR